MSFYVNLQVAL